MRITEINLTEKQKVQLEYAVHFDDRQFLKIRCQIVLLKNEGLSSKSIADKLGISEPKVNRWVHRYLSSGFEGLRNKPGQGAKRIMDESDEQAVREAIEKDRLSLKKAKERWQKATGKYASESTFRNFLSVLAQDLDV